MTPAPTAPPPGSMTVPPLFGWELILVVLVLIVLAAVAGLVLLAAGRGVSARNEWQAWLDARSAQRRQDGAVGADDGADPEIRSRSEACQEETVRPTRRS